MKPPEFNPSWNKDVLALYRHDIQEIWDPTIALHIWNQYHNQLDLYYSLVPTDRFLDILDVGCAQATLALRLAEAGHRVCAIDLRKKFLDYAASRYEKGDIQFIQGNVLQLEMEKTFDLIFANQIIEHLVYPLEMVKRLECLLKPGGRLVVTTPNGQYLKQSLPSYKALGDPKQWAHRQFSADGDGHFFAYLEDELKEIFDQSGFLIVEINYFETPWISGHMKIRYLHKIFPIKVLKTIDRYCLKIPVVKKKLSHQLMVIGRKKNSRIYPDKIPVD
jgi:2-polyprenyl-3-methyl-5-hydroxy-6-metoxy-1,4-benzoquinol methylase